MGILCPEFTLFASNVARNIKRGKLEASCGANAALSFSLRIGLRTIGPLQNNDVEYIDISIAI
jgi:hypothetical protein